MSQKRYEYKFENECFIITSGGVINFKCENFFQNFPEYKNLTFDQICANIKKIFKIGS